MSKPKKPAQPTRVRPVGPARTHTYEVPLGTDDVDRLHKNLLDHLDHREEIKQKLADAKKAFASQLETNEVTIDTIRRQIRQGVERRSIEVQDYLTKSNEVVTVAVKSDQIIGEPRTATAAELQESMPLDDTPAADDEEDADDGVTFQDGTGSPPLDDLPAFDA